MCNQLDQSTEPTCKVCFSPASGCACPECPQCGERGRARCYTEHPLKLNQFQLVLRTEKHIEKMREELDLEEQYLQMLNEQPDGYCENWSEI